MNSKTVHLRPLVHLGVEVGKWSQVDTLATSSRGGEGSV